MKSYLNSITLRGFLFLVLGIVLMLTDHAMAAPLAFGGMILDTYNEFCHETDIAAAASTALVGNVIDLGANPADLGVIEQMYLVIRTTTEIITAGTAGTIQFKLSSDAQAAIATDGTATDHLISAEYVTDDAAANDDELNAGGTILAARLPSGTYERYLGILAIIGTTEVTAGEIDAFLTTDINKWKSYPDADN